MSPSAQFTLDLGHRTAVGREDFLVASSNADAVRWLDLWPEWPGSGLVVHGPSGCGKSHLASVWRERSRADILPAGHVSAVRSDAAMSSVIVEDVDHGFDERAMLHLYNSVIERQGYMLLTADRAPNQWDLSLADLNSRISALPSVAVASPDDHLLAAVLVKLFADRQLSVSEDVIWYLVARMERSFAVARSLVADLDKAALSEKRRVTIPLIRRHLDLS